MEDEWHYHIDQATRASRVLRFIESDCDDDGDVYRTFASERLARAVSDAQGVLGFSNRVIEEAGYLDAFETHMREILANLHPSHLPDMEKEVLRDMGIVNPDAEIREMVYAARASWERIDRSTREIPIRQQLKSAEERLDAANHDFQELKKKGKAERSDNEGMKSRRWFKGLGQIVQGSALSIADVALAVGVLQFPVSPETRTWGSLVSVSTGIGVILNGVGDLRNE